MGSLKYSKQGKKKNNFPEEAEEKNNSDKNYYRKQIKILEIIFFFLVSIQLKNKPKRGEVKCVIGI